MSDSCDPMDCSLPGSSVHGILQARILEWVAISFTELGIEWFALEMNTDHSVIFEIAFKCNWVHCIADSFVDYEGYSISSKGFLPTVVDIMVI